MTYSRDPLPSTPTLGAFKMPACKAEPKKLWGWGCTPGKSAAISIKALNEQMFISEQAVPGNFIWGPCWSSEGQLALKCLQGKG